MRLLGARSARVRWLAAVVTCVMALAACSTSPGEELIGTWETGAATLEVSEDTIVTSIPAADLDVEATYTVTESTVELTDQPGGQACSANAVGTYEWEVTDDVLTLTLVSDPCDGRAGTLGGSTWTRNG